MNYCYVNYFLFARAANPIHDRDCAKSIVGFESSGSRVYLDCLMQTRGDAWALLCEYTRSESLRKHALAVEAVMRAYARRLGEDQHKWGLVGMLHDFDYEMYPNPPDHPMKGSEILREQGYSDEIRRAILGHANYTGVARDTLLARGLYACDELTGFVVACALVRPNGIWDLESKSVKKKLKDKAFARTVNRDEVYEGAEELAVDLGEHIDFIIAALREVAEDVGLKLRAGELNVESAQQQI
jgi:putative nucleotidyltransferase with HDIG domain